MKRKLPLLIAALGLAVIGFCQTPAGSALGNLNVNSPGYVNCGNSNVFNLSGEFTIECWIARTAPGANDKIVGKTTIGDGFVFGIQNGLYAEVWQPAQTEIQDVGTFPDFFNWVHIAITFKPGNELRGYINGVLVGSETVASSNLATNTNDLIIGVAPWDINSSAYDGYLDELKFWNVEKTASDIKNDMHTALSGSESNLLAYYNFDGGTGSTVTNLSTVSGLNGTMQGNISWETPSYAVIGSSTMQAMSDVKAMWLGMTNDAITDLRVVNSSNGMSIVTVIDSLNYLMFGHDNAQGTTTNDLPSTASTLSYKRAQRTWLIEDETIDSIFSSQLIFDISDVSAGGDSLDATQPYYNYALFRRDATTGDFTEIQGATSISGDKIIFDDVAVSSGYYTVGVGTASLFGVDGVAKDLSQYVSVFPNPSNGVFQIHLDNVMNINNTSLTVSNVLGENVYTSVLISKETYINLSDFPFGIYNLSLISNNYIIRKSIVIE